MKRTIPLMVIIAITLAFSLTLNTGCTTPKRQKKKQPTSFKDVQIPPWLALGDDKRLRAVQVELVNIIEKSDKDSSNISSKYYKRAVKWFKKAAVTHNIKVKYQSDEDFEIIGVCVTNASNSIMSRAFTCTVRVGTAGGVIGIAITNWKFYYPKTSYRETPFYRNFENEPQGNFPHNWPIVKSYMQSILYSWQNSMFKPGELAELNK